MEWQEVYNRSHELLRAGKHEQAYEILSKAADNARKKGASNDAAFFSNALGSAFAAQHRDKEALEAYIQAERDDPSDVQLALSTAWHMWSAIGSADEARKKTLNVMSRLPSESPLLIKALTIVGVTALASGNLAEAAERLTALRDATHALPSRNCDLTLVEALLHQRASVDLCRVYLAEVRTKAEREKNVPLLRQIREIENLAQ